MTENNHKDHWQVSFNKLDKNDLQLIEAAISVLKANFHAVKHQIGCALRTESGKIYTAVNIKSSGPQGISRSRFQSERPTPRRNAEGCRN